MYQNYFGVWVQQYGMSSYLGPADHFAIKVEDENEFEKIVTAFLPYCVEKKNSTPGLSVRTMHGRSIAVALLKHPLTFGEEFFDCIEIMQPRPEKQGTDVVGIDHLELITPKLKEIEALLKNARADFYVDATNPYKEIVVSFVNDKRWRIKFTNKTLEEIVPLQIRDEPERVKILLL